MLILCILDVNSEEESTPCRENCGEVGFFAFVVGDGRLEGRIGATAIGSREVRWPSHLNGKFQPRRPAVRRLSIGESGILLVG